jgi:phenylalanyl-tRNA synthetase alpha chain
LRVAPEAIYLAMPEEILLNEAAYAVWQTVKERGPIELGDVVDQTGVDQAQVSAAVTEAAAQGFFQVKEREREELIPVEGWSNKFGDLPERKAAEWLCTIPGNRVPMANFVRWAKESSVPVNEVFKWGTARGWIGREKSKGDTDVYLTIGGASGLKTPDDDYRALARTDYSKHVFLDELVLHGIKADRVRQLLGNRPELAKIRKRTERVAELTAKGSAVFQPNIRVVKERNTLTSEDIESGAWREIKLRPYDVKLAAKDIYPAKIHPLRKIIEQTRRAFLEMGFTEVVSPMVESAFWNFDALFQPQDHPARDMQDTFYMRDPVAAPLPDAKVVEPVRRTHEDGWETGSEGWGYTWSPERSKQVVLRTHTTAATIRALAANPNPPGKFFCVGWTYRNETISFKHLPVFHQVDGIVIDEEANLASLMGTLQEFYSKMGFGRVKFKPAFYPYTEPSVDVVVYMESRKKWLEMGGAGIFRPEVTLPLGCKYPVLAWGLGIERLAMLRFGLADIRDLYGTNLNELEKVPLCR